MAGVGGRASHRRTGAVAVVLALLAVLPGLTLPITAAATGVPGPVLADAAPAVGSAPLVTKAGPALSAVCGSACPGTPAVLDLAGPADSARSVLDGLWTTEPTVTTGLAVPKLPSGDGTVAFGSLLRTGNDAGYRAVLDIDASGTVGIGLQRLNADGDRTSLGRRSGVVEGVTPADRLLLVVEVTRTDRPRLTAKVWRLGEAVPDTQVTAEDDAAGPPVGGGAAWTADTTSPDGAAVRIWSYQVADAGTVVARGAVTGWPAAAVGGSYRYSSADAFTEGGLITLASGGQSADVELPGVAGQDLAFETRFAFGTRAVAGNGTSFALQARKYGQTFYQAVARYAPDGNVILRIDRQNGSPAAVTGLDAERVVLRGIAPGTELALRLETTTAADGTGIRAGLTPVGAAPAWQISVADAAVDRIDGAGSVDLWAYSSKTSGPSTVRVDSFTVTSIVQPGSTDAGAGIAAGWTRPVATGAGVGSAPVGTAAYPVPVGAVVASPDGDDSAAGTQTAPVRTLGRALTLVRAGGTVVLRAGTYHESVTVTKPGVTIQSYPDEAVWLDGSSVVRTWTASGGSWVHGGWPYEFDSSPTYTRGAPDGTSEGWQNVSPSFPMAAHPDQVWLDGVPQRQVDSADQVGTGTFFVDTAASRLYLGTDPAGHEVRASTLVMAMDIQSPDVTVRGVGVRGYATSIPDMGTVRVDEPAARVTFENDVIVDNATIGLSISSVGGQLRNLTVARNGLLGIHGHFADRLTLTAVAVADNNAEDFNVAPIAGGVKVTRAAGMTVRGSEFVRNRGNGLWCDESCYGFTVSGSHFAENDSGLYFELSAKGLFAGNRLTDNRLAALVVHNSSDVQIWNNAMSGNKITVWLNQDSRAPTSAGTYGRDKRRPFPDPEMTWELQDIVIANNALSRPAGSELWCGVVCVYDQTRTRTAAQMDLSLNGNVYHRTDPDRPSFLVRWSVARAGGNWVQYATLRDFAAATGQDRRSVERTGPDPIANSGYPRAEIATLGARVGLPVPSRVAAITGLAPGLRFVGPAARQGVEEHLRPSRDAIAPPAIENANAPLVRPLRMTTVTPSFR